MAKKLLIVESPAKIKTISKFLGKDFRIMSTVGHIKDLPPKKLGVSVDGGITIDYVVIEDKQKVISDICKEASTSTDIYLAPDPDREGEIIAWHIGQEIEKVAKKTAKIHRIAFNEITEPAIINAIENPGEIDLNKVAAQQARRVLDRWVGYEVSPILWKKITKGLSAGRVQSVALRLISDREEAIRGFKPEEYWSIHGDFLYDSAHIIAELAQINGKKADITNEKDANAIVEKIKKASYIIESVTDKTRSKNPVAPFMTSTLQQAAYNQLGFAVKKTMQTAQKLYEGLPIGKDDTPVALITYMRTDSLRIADTAITQVRGYIGKTYSKEYLPSKANVYEKKSKAKAQDAHEAIRPIDVNVHPDKVKAYLPKDAAKLYELIWKRFVACQMTPALYAQRQVVIEGSGGLTFKVTGSTLIFDGYLKVYSAAEGDEEKEGKVVLPASLKAKQPTKLTKVDPKQHFTQPPPRFTEASLVKDMEKEGIGRPSTYATILSTIQARSYTQLDDKKRFVPTELGMMVTKLLVENLPEIMDVKFTAHMEENLDKIAQGDLDRDKLLKDFYKTFKKDLEKFAGTDGKTKRVVEPTEVECPECKKAKLVVRFGKAGEFLGCPNYPECKFTCNFQRTADNKLECVEAKEPVVLDEKCPDCGSPLRQVIGRYGPFIACSNYPNCKYIHKNKAKFPCPLDGGEVVQRKWRGGNFWGCSNYPKCKFAVFGDIEETPCPKCKAPFLVKKTAKDGTVTLFCHDKACGYKK